MKLIVTVRPTAADLIVRSGVLALGVVSATPTPVEAVQVRAWARRWYISGPAGPARSIDVYPAGPDESGSWLWLDEDRFWARVHASGDPPEEGDDLCPVSAAGGCSWWVTRDGWQWLPCGC